jgi:ATP-binding protein involved in chromosome partitioning
VKRYHDIVGDGGSRILEQVAEQRTRITGGLAGVRHLVAVGSGKGGVGKSTLTLHLAGALRARGRRIAILDADFNGPSQARMAGVQGALFVPGRQKVALPQTRNGIAVFSMGSVIPESEALEFESASDGDSHTWRATKEFALLGEILAAVEWGALDLLMFDLPPGAERTVQYADFLGPRTSFLLVTIPSEVARGVVARSAAALSKGPNRLLGYVENMSGYYCRDCGAIKPLFVSPDQPPPVGSHSDPTPSGPDRSVRFRGRTRRSAEASAEPGPSGLGIRCLGTVPFDPELARHCDQGIPLAALPETPVGLALEHVAQQLLDSLESTTSAPAHVSNELRRDKPASAHGSSELRPGKPASADASHEPRPGTEHPR